jgi:glycosyltransferase involved in cell wall biosynthesis
MPTTLRVVHRTDYADAMSAIDLFKKDFPDLASKFPLSEFSSGPLVGSIISILCGIVDSIPCHVPVTRIAMLNAGSGCAMWRMSIPAMFIETKDIEVSLFASEKDFHLDELRGSQDVIFAQWIANYAAISEVSAAKARGVRLVYDMDDNYMDVPLDNPSRDVVDVCGISAMHSAAAMADCITVTTDVLAERVRKSFPGVPVVVIPNSMDTTEEGWRNPEDCGSKDGSVKIFWAGGVSHRRDLQVCLSAIDSILHDYPNTIFITAGYKSPDIELMALKPHWKGRYFHLGGVDSYQYFEKLKTLNADIGIAPLEDDSFNQCKSNIKFIEYTMAGMPTVASRVGPYSDTMDHKVDGFLPKNTHQDWYHCLSKLVESRQKRLEMVISAKKKVVANWDIRKHRQKWVDALIPKL